ncbi:MAG: glycosyltransferase [Planctomycetes bacterium]|nr:glycosyltransferase [Planctomycetota bacterium]
MFHFAVAAVAVVILAPGLVTALHLGLMATASVFFRAPTWKGDAPRVRFLVVIPAHNEELLLGRTLEAINADKRGDDQVLVVDDRSTDRTGEIAREHGAVVLTRVEGEEPGRAPARQAAIRRSAEMEWDAMVMVDADSVIEHGFFAECEQALGAGAVALQARSEAARGSRMVDQAALASFAIQGVTLPRGREVLRAPVRLRGTGMVLRRDVLERLDFRAKASEDLQVSLDLVQEGVRTRHVERARLRSANADSWKIASTQKQRYEAGRMAAAREFVPKLLRCRSWAGLEAAWFLVSPPFATAAGLTVLGTLVALLVGAWPVVWVGVGAVGLLGLAFTIASVQARVGWRVLLALAVAPFYVAWKLIVQLKALLRLRGGLKEFGSTERVAK